MEKDKLLSDIESLGINREYIFKETNISMEEIRDILTSIENIEKVLEIGKKALKSMEKEDKYNLYLEKIENISKKDSAFDEKIKNAAVNKEIEKYLEYLSELKIYWKKQVKMLLNGMKN